MSLLDRGNEDVLVFPEETFTDADGNSMRRAATVGIPTKARVRPAAQSGTSARRAEQDNEGFEGEAVYKVRFPRSFTAAIGAQSKIEWRGATYSVIGDPLVYTGSSRTAHRLYTMRRT